MRYDRGERFDKSTFNEGGSPPTTYNPRPVFRTNSFVLRFQFLERNDSDANYPRRNDWVKIWVRFEYRGTSLVRKRLPLGPHSRFVRMVLRRS